MSAVQIPNLGAAIALNGTEQLEAVQAGTSVRVTTQQISNFARGSLNTVSAGKVLGRDTASGTGPVQELPIAVDASGNVGIGTSSPSYSRLHVLGSGVTQGVKVESTSTNQFDGAVMYLRGAAGTTRSTGLIHYNTNVGGTNSAFNISSYGATDNFLATLALYEYSSNSWQLYTNGTERLRINTGGNVGIGTSAPTINLQVAGTYAQMGTLDGTVDNRFISTSGGNAGIFGTISNHPLVAYTNNTERMRIDTSGNVGIGTSTPDARLTVASNTAAQISASDGVVGQVVGYCAGGAIAYSGTATNHPLAFLTNNTERMRIDASGNVGIGTIAPGSYGKLAVAGSGTVLSQIVSDNTGEGQLIFNSVVAGRITVTGAFPLILQTNNVERVRVTGEGNVGIATSTPNASAILDVSSTTGGVLFPRLTTTQRDAIGSPANGLVLYNITTDKLQVRAAGAWVDLH